MRYLGISFGVYLSPIAIWDWFLDRLHKKLPIWEYMNFPFIDRLNVVSKILQASHIYYASCCLPNKVQFGRLELILCSYLWVEIVAFPWFLRMFSLCTRMGEALI